MLKEKVKGKQGKKKKEKQECKARIKNGPPQCAVYSPTTLPSTTPPPREVKHPRMTLKKKRGNQYTLTFQSLSPKQPQINPASSRKTFLQQQLLLTTECGVKITEWMMFPTLGRGKQGSRLSLRSRSICTQDMSTERNEGGCRGTRRLELGGQQSAGQRSQSQSNKRRRRLGPQLSMTVQQREGDRNPELSPQEGRDPEESYT